METSKRAYAMPRSAAPRAPAPWQSTADPYLHRRRSEFCRSICGVSGSWCAQGLFEPPEHLWRGWGLILNMNSPLIPSCWGFSFAPGNGISLHTCFSTVQLPLRFGHSKHLLPTTQEKTTYRHHQMVNTKIRLIIFFAAKDGEALIQSAKTRPGADCGSDHVFLIAKFRLKLNKVEKTLDQIPYDYTVEVTN